MSFILPGKFQTDQLEASFVQTGWLRGDQYKITLEFFLSVKTNQNASSFKIELTL